MKKNTAKIIVLVAVVLILLNSVLIASVLGGKNKYNGPRPINEMNEFMIKEIGFDEEQASKFIQLANEHHHIQRRNQNRFRKQKDQINDMLVHGQHFDIDSASNVLAEVTRIKEVSYYRFMKEVMAICTDDQRKKLQGVFFEAGGVPPHGRMPGIKGPPPPHRRE